MVTYIKGIAFFSSSTFLAFCVLLCIKSSRIFSVLEMVEIFLWYISGFLALLLPLTLIGLMEIDIEERFSVVPDSLNG